MILNSDMTNSVISVATICWCVNHFHSIHLWCILVNLRWASVCPPRKLLPWQATHTKFMPTFDVNQVKRGNVSQPWADSAQPTPIMTVAWIPEIPPFAFMAAIFIVIASPSLKKLKLLSCTSFQRREFAGWREAGMWVCESSWFLCVFVPVCVGSEVDRHTWFLDMTIWVPLPSGHHGSARVECLKVAFIVFIVSCLCEHKHIFGKPAWEKSSWLALIWMKLMPPIYWDPFLTVRSGASLKVIINFDYTDI